MALPKAESRLPVTMPAPLFDRLADENPEQKVELQPFQTYSIDETLLSIAQELDYLLNTRTSQIPYSIYASRENLMDTDVSHRYGLPDFARFDTTDSFGAKRLARQIRRTVEDYESRLSNVTVRLIGMDNRQKLIVEISGIVYAMAPQQRFTFSVKLDRQPGE